MSDNRSLDDLVGKMIGRYVVEEKIGEGGFLTVFKGKLPSLPRPVAIKVLNHPAEKGRLTREAAILSKVDDQQNIVQVQYADLMNDEDLPYVVVEHCEDALDRMLRDSPAKKPGLGHEVAVRYAIEISDALSHIHGKGVIHGDIKPSNILVKEGRPKLSDFNTKDIDEKVLLNSLLLSKELSMMEHWGAQKGRTATAIYLTPEHTKPGAELTPQSDVYQLGMVLHEMATGERFWHKTKSPSDVGAPKWLDDIVERATANKPKDRFGSAEELKEALQNGLAGKFDKPTVKREYGKKILNGVKKAAKLAALAPTVWAWGPPYLIKKANDRDDRLRGDGFGMLVLSVFGNFVYFAAGIPLGINYGLENPAERRTVERCKDSFESAPEDLHLAFLNNDKLRMIPINSLAVNGEGMSEYVLPNFSTFNNRNSIIGIDDGKCYYTSSEDLVVDGDDRKFPQILSLDLSSGKFEKLIDYSKEENHWTEGVQIREAYVGEDVEKKTSLVRLNNNWYGIKEGVLDKLSMLSLPISTVQKVLPGTGIEFTSSEGGYIQYNNVDRFLGDVEIFSGTNPMIVSYTPNKE